MYNIFIYALFDSDGLFFVSLWVSCFGQKHLLNYINVLENAYNKVINV